MSIFTICRLKTAADCCQHASESEAHGLCVYVYVYVFM